MTASKVALYVRLPRTTVMRKLEALTELGLAARRGQNYYVSDERAKTVSSDYLKRTKKIIHEAARELAT